MSCDSCVHSDVCMLYRTFKNNNGLFDNIVNNIVGSFLGASMREDIANKTRKEFIRAVAECCEYHF